MDKEELIKLIKGYIAKRTVYLFKKELDSMSDLDPGGAGYYTMGAQELNRFRLWFSMILNEHNRADIKKALAKDPKKWLE